MNRPTVLLVLWFSAFTATGSLQEPGGASEEAVRVAAIRFEGAPWLDRPALVDRLGVAPGDLFDQQALTRGLGRILAIEGVASVAEPILQTSADGLTILVEIEPRPIVRTVEFIGRRSIDREELGQGMRTVPSEYFHAADLEEDRSSTINRYHEEGFLFASVTTRVTPADQSPGSVDVAFEVEEGRRVTIRKIHVQGNVLVPTRHIQGVLRHRRRLLWGLLSAGFYVPSRFQEDLDRVLKLYRDRGFLSVVARRGALVFSDDFREIELTIIVDEGPRYRIEAIELGGSNPVLDRALKFQIRSRPGTFYNGKLLEEDRVRLIEFYQRETLRSARLTLRHFFKDSADDHRVRVAFDVDERRHSFTGRVEIVGNSRTLPRVVRARSHAVPGEPLTELDLRDTAHSVLGLSIFEDVDVRTIPASSEQIPWTLERLPDDDAGGGGASEMRDVRIQAKEKSAGEGLIEIGGGASSGEGEVAFVRLTQPNFDLFDIPGGGRGWKYPFRGRGQLLELEIFPGTEISEYRVRFEDPYIYNSYHKLSLGSTGQQYQWRTFDETHILGFAGLTRYWDHARHFSTSASWALRDVNIADTRANAPREVAKVAGHNFLSYPAVLLAYTDTSNSRYSGNAGFEAQTRLEAPLRATGSAADYVKSVTEVEYAVRLNRRYNRMFEKMIFDEDNVDLSHKLRFRGKLGWMEDVGSGETPFFDRFTLGGPRSFRGFEFRGIGPRRRGAFFGGDAFWSASAEYSLPLFFRELRAVALIDIGDLEDSFSRLSLDRIRSAAGGGLEVRLPLPGFVQPVPISLFWVETLRKQPGDREQLFTFTLGYVF